MSTSIRHRYHGGNVYINTEKVITGNAITANNIPALTKSDRYRYHPYLGVIDDSAPPEGAEPVKLVNITGFWWNDIGMGSDGHEIPINSIVKGYYINGGYYIAIADDKPIHLPLAAREPKNYHTDNVFPIRPTPQKP